MGKKREYFLRSLFFILTNAFHSSERERSGEGIQYTLIHLSLKTVGNVTANLKGVNYSGVWKEIRRTRTLCKRGISAYARACVYQYVGIPSRGFLARRSRRWPACRPVFLVGPLNSASCRRSLLQAIYLTRMGWGGATVHNGHKFIAFVLCRATLILETSQILLF